MKLTEEFEKHLTSCDVCRKWMACNMVEPLRGWPTREDYQLRDARQILERIEFWCENKNVLKEHGIDYDPSVERIGAYLNHLQLNEEGRPVLV